MTKKRAVVVWVLVGLATLLTLISTFTVWAKRQIVDTNGFTNATAQVLANDEVRTTLAQTLVDRLYQQSDVTQRLRQRLPPAAKGAAPVIAAALRTAALRVAEAFLASPAAQQAFERATRRAHGALMKVIEGKSVGRLSTSEGTVTLDLGPLLDKVGARAGIQNRVAARENAQGQIVLLRSDQLSAIQKAVRWVKALSLFLLFLVLFLYALAVYLARGRRRVVLEVIGCGFVVVGLIIIAVRRIAGPAVVDSLVKTEADRPAAKAVFAIETQILRDIAIALIAYGVFMILAGFLAGPSRFAVGTRRVLAPVFHRPLVAFGAALVIILLLIAWGPTGASRQWLGILILGGLFLLAVEAWRRQIVREFPADYPGPTGWASLRRARPAEATEAGEAESRVDALERLAQLRASGALTDEEFGVEKARLLGDGGTPAVQVPPGASQPEPS